jgi:hypothetical protein
VTDADERSPGDSCSIPDAPHRQCNQQFLPICGVVLDRLLWHNKWQETHSDKTVLHSLLICHIHQWLSRKLAINSEFCIYQLLSRKLAINSECHIHQLLSRNRAINSSISCRPESWQSTWSY